MPRKQEDPVYFLRYEPRRALATAAGMTPWAELAHRRFCDLVWAGQPWPPSTPELAAQLARVPVPEWEHVMPQLGRAKWRVSKGQLVNSWVARQRQEAEA